ncbi:MAG: N-acetylmuramoyl-L-alanine amidase, partial [Oscillospiraceae bacterium]
ANDSSYSFSDAAVANAEWIVKKLMSEYGIPAERVVRHYDVTGKLCPGIAGWNKDSGSEDKWTEFKASLTANAPKYYVQVGAFSDRVNAENYLKAVKTVYPDAFIKTV